MANYDNETNLVEDEYDDLDDFIVESDDGGNAVEVDDDDDNDEDDEQDQEQPEVQEEEEEEEPPVGQQEILNLRERLKADLRRQYQANAAGAGKASSSSSVQAPVRAKFGNFFGPSRLSLAPRLIEAGCSSIMREVQNAPSRKGFAAPSVASKTQPNASAHQQKPKIVSQEIRKVDMLRQNRDYSDLFSDDANIPPATKEEPDSKPVMARKSDVEVRGPMQSAGKRKVPTNQPARTLKQHGSIQSRVQSKTGSLGKEPLPNGRKTIAAVRNGSSLPNNRKAPGLQPSSNGQDLQCSMQNKRQQAAPSAGQRQQQPSQTQRPPQPSSQSQRLKKHGPPLSSQVSRMNSSSMIQSQRSAQSGSVQSLDRSRLAQKQLGPTAIAKLPRKNAVHDDHANKKRVVKRKCSDKNKAILMIREMFNYNPEKFSGRDEDDRDMEADYRSIQMEERRSERLGKKEDEEQLRLIEEEERRKRTKKRKQ